MSNSFLWYQDPDFIPYPSFFVDEATQRTLRPKLDQGSFDHECYQGVCEMIAEEQGDIDVALMGQRPFTLTDIVKVIGLDKMRRYEEELELRVSMWQEMNKAISEVLDV